ncbi:hypothetical protein M404DRAFT_443756 [Pisolithus tinctorius Marx 270]|uniref:Uncharacterized protein n=1 Tax=Pisolithus tinctorius Marx 270 TaxID=870435 RepID=A0A0C3I9B8_PISTI|nr:hypothetical protein M404DRAFT_443756 [Pisolithus tinctorius Marx 270]
MVKFKAGKQLRWQLLATAKAPTSSTELRTAGTTASLTGCGAQKTEYAQKSDEHINRVNDLNNMGQPKQDMRSDCNITASTICTSVSK